MSFTHEHSWKVAASPERIMAALTEPAQLRQWFAEHADVEIEPGGRYRFWGRHTLGTPAEGDAQQRVLRYEAGRQLAFTWRLHGVETEVAIALAAEGEKSRLTLRHEVNGDLPMPRPTELIDDHWRLAIANLSVHLAAKDAVVLPDYADPKPEVRLTVDIHATREAVFRALVEPSLVNQWFGSKSAIIEPRAGGRYELGWKYQVAGKDVDGGPTAIVEIVPNEKLVLAWPDWRGDASVTGQTISFHLESVGAGTRLTFVHAGFGRTADMGDYGFGWQYFLGNLVTLLTAPASMPGAAAVADHTSPT